MRKRAGESPEDLELQRMLFNELMEEGSEAKDKEELIGRWEELTGLWTEGEVKTSEALKDDQLFQLYLRALAAQAATAEDPPSYFTRIHEAPTKRAAVLEGIVAAAAPSTPSQALTATPAPTPEQVATPSPTASASTSASATPQATLTPSALVSALFSGPAGRGKGGEAKILSKGSFGSSWATPFGGASAAKGGVEPIRVVVEEAKSPILLRAVRFLFVTALYSFLL